MNVELLKEQEDAAREKWREYKEAAKKTRDPVYMDLKNVYNQIKNGKAVINIYDAIKSGGIRADNCHPKLAIAMANKKVVYCRYKQDGTVEYRSRSEFARYVSDFELKNCLPTFTIKGRDGWGELHLKAPVPIIPPRLRPLKLNEDYFILWEVDSWTPLPSRDPYLLKRVTSEIFVVCGAWDLTDIEIKVMQGR